MAKLVFLFKTLAAVPIKLFSKVSIFTLTNNSSIHPSVSIQSGTRVYNSSVNKYSYISKDCVIVNTKIGKFCSIAGNVIINAGKHPTDFISTSPVFYSKKNSLKKYFNIISFEEYDTVTIGNDVWIGTHAFIKGGIKIGDGAIIGAYTIVTKDVEPYSIVVGNPGKVLRKRFNENAIKELLRIQWWNFDDDTLFIISKNMNNINDFISICNDRISND